MLTPESYISAWVVYVLAVCAGIWLLDGWFRGLGGSWRLAIALVLAALALAPAHPDPGGDTWAPAIFVLGFDLLTDGVEAAGRSLQPLLAGQAIALVLLCLALLARLFSGGGSSGGDS